MKEHRPVVSAAELDALIQDWGATPHRIVDKFFPIRFWYLFLLTLSHAVSLLFFSESVAHALSQSPVEVVRIEGFLYFRGWFLLAVGSIGLYAYFRDKYFALVFSAFLVVGGCNLVFDMFTLYEEKLAQATPLFTLLLMLRMVALWFTYLSVKNASRLPAMKDRANIFLPFRRNADD